MSPPSLQDSLPAGWLSLYREGVEPSGSLQKVSDHPSSFSGLSLAQGKFHGRSAPVILCFILREKPSIERKRWLRGRCRASETKDLPSRRQLTLTSTTSGWAGRIDRRIFGLHYGGE